MEYFKKLVCRAFIAVALTLLTALAVTAQPIATVLAIEGNASGPQGAIKVGDRIEDGLIIRTNTRTQLELEFDDGTRMAIGPNSELAVTAVLMNSNSGQANRFAINTTVGSFRFLSGNSRREAYELTTPTSTIGIRGTEFDIFVENEVTAVTLYRGALELCLINSGKCWGFRGSCYLAKADAARNTVRGLRGEEALDYFSNFIYARSQSSLSRALHTSINSCNRFFLDDDDDDNDNDVVQTETEVQVDVDIPEEPMEPETGDITDNTDEPTEPETGDITDNTDQVTEPEPETPQMEPADQVLDDAIDNEDVPETLEDTVNSDDQDTSQQEDSSPNELGGCLINDAGDLCIDAVSNIVIGEDDFVLYLNA